MLELMVRPHLIGTAAVFLTSFFLCGAFVRQFHRLRKIENRLSNLLKTDVAEQKLPSTKLIIEGNPPGFFSILLRITKLAMCAIFLIGLCRVYFAEKWDPFFLFYFLPIVILGVILILEKRIVKSRLEAFRLQFPEFLDLLISGSKAGLSLERICNQAELEFSFPLKMYMAQINEKLSIGHPIEEVIQHLATQNRLEELNFLAAAIKLQRSSGGQLAEVLTQLRMSLVQSDEHKKLVRSLTAEGRAAAIVIVFLIFVSLAALFVFNPAQFLFLLEDSSGQDILLYSGVSVVFGIYSIYLMTGAAHE